MCYGNKYISHKDSQGVIIDMLRLIFQFCAVFPFLIHHSHYLRYIPWSKVLLGGRTAYKDATYCVSITLQATQQTVTGVGWNTPILQLLCEVCMHSCDTVYVSIGMGECYSALLQSTIALQFTLVDKNPFQLFLFFISGLSWIKWRVSVSSLELSDSGLS